MQYLSFCGWPISLNIISYRFPYVVTYDRIFSLFFMYRMFIEVLFVMTKIDNIKRLILSFYLDQTNYAIDL